MPKLSQMLPAEDRLVLLPKNPGAFFVLWRLGASRMEAFRSGSLGGEVELRLLYSDDKAHAFSRKAAWDAGGAYLEVPVQGGNYIAALYAQRGGEWEKLLDSNSAAAPSAAGMASERAYASLEFYKRGLL